MINLLILIFSVVLLSSNKDPTDLPNRDNLQTENRISFNDFTSTDPNKKINFQVMEMEKIKNVLEDTTCIRSNQLIELSQSGFQRNKKLEIKVNASEFIPAKDNPVIENTGVISPEVEEIQIDSVQTFSTKNITTNSVTITSLPQTPTLSSPYNGTNVGGTTVSLIWNTVSNASEYYLQMSGDSSFSTLYKNQSVGNTYGISLSGFPDAGGIFYWRVRAGNSEGWGSWSSAWYFINGPSTYPSTPTLSSPYNGSNASGQQVALQWNPSTKADHYQLQLSLDSSFYDTVYDDVVGNSIGIQFNSFPDDGTIFYWRVRAENSIGWSNWSSAWYFENGPSSTPGIVSLKNPSNGSNVSGEQINLEWYSAARANYYQLQVATDNVFRPIFIQGRKYQ